MAYVLVDVFGPQIEDVNGVPEANGSIEAYVSGTSTPTAMYADSSGTSLGTSCALNSRGYPQTAGGTETSIFATTAVIYKFVVKDSAGSVLKTIDPFYPGVGAQNLTYTTAAAGGTEISLQNILEDGYAYISQFGPTGGGADDSTAIQNAINARDTIWVDDDYYYSALTISSDKTFAGPGSINGLATSGTKPTRANLTGAANSAARLALLDTYYSGTITISANVKIYGELTLSDSLIVGSGGATYLDVRGIVTVSDVSLHGIGWYPKGGMVESDSGMIVSDSAAKSIQCSLGGKVNAASPVVVSAVGRSLECSTGGHISASAAEIYNGGDEGVYTNMGGNISIPGATIDSCAGDGILTNYGGNINLGAGTVNNCTGSGLAAESGGQIYAVGATITGNGQSGIFSTYGGTVQATGSTITGNTLHAIDCRGNSVVNALTATIDTTNNSGGVQVRTLQGGVVFAEEPGVGSGKTALSSSDYDPPWQIDGPAGSYIGETNPSSPGVELGSVYPKPILSTIAAGILTISGYVNSVETESAAATDDVDTIVFTHGVNSMAVIYPNSDVRTVVIKNGTGNITTSTGSDITLDTDDKGAIVTRIGTNAWAMPIF